MDVGRISDLQKPHNQPRRSRTHRLLLAAVCATAATSLAPTAFAADFGSIIIFGDSLSDVGNAYNSDFHLDPTSPYYKGRFSNGPLWVEDLAADLSIATPTPSTSGGKDFAYGGVHTGTGTTKEVIFNFPNIATQISNYLSASKPAANDLFVVWGGGNDFIDGQTNPTVPVSNTAAEITTLANAGAKTIIVPNLPDLGKVPRFLGTGSQSTMSSLSNTFNTDLNGSLTALAGSLNIQIDQLNIASLFSNIIANPSTDGFTNVTQSADNNGTVVSNPDQYLFWDDIHPTRIGHQLIASAAFDLVSTHNWIATASTAAWSTTTNWSPAQAIDSTWIANLQNTTTTPKTASVSTSSTVRQIQITGTSSGPNVGTMTVSVQPGVTLSASTSVNIGFDGALNLQSASTLCSPSITIQSGGLLTGNGTLTGNLTSNGILSPTGGQQSLAITGSFTQSAAGTLSMNLAGTSTGQFSTLQITNQANLIGAITVTATNNFTPLPGESFRIMNFASHVGATPTIYNHTLYPGLHFAPIFTSTNLSLLASATPGDLNLDGTINSADFATFAAYYGQTNQTWLTGDFNADGTVNALDFNALATNFGDTASAALPASVVVPEPCGVMICLSALWWFSTRKSRNPLPPHAK